MNDGAKSFDNVLSPSSELREVLSLLDPSRVFSSMSRLNASTPLSTPSDRGAVDDDDNDSGIVLARKGFSAVDVGARLGREYCSCDGAAVVRSGTRASRCQIPL